MARRPRDAAATRQEILDAAEKLFASKGFGSTSLSAIARDCGVHKSLILHHFESKEGLWQEVKSRRLAPFVQEQTGAYAEGEVSLDELLSTTRAYFELLRGDPVLVQLMTRAELEQDMSCSPYDEQRLAPFVERMRAAQRHGLLRDDLPPAHLLLILINVITQWFEARKSFIGWSELDESTADAVFLETLECVFLDGARSRTGESVAVSQNERAVKGAGSHVL